MMDPDPPGGLFPMKRDLSDHCQAGAASCRAPLNAVRWAPLLIALSLLVGCGAPPEKEETVKPEIPDETVKKPSETAEDPDETMPPEPPAEDVPETEDTPPPEKNDPDSPEEGEKSAGKDDPDRIELPVVGDSGDPVFVPRGIVPVQTTDPPVSVPPEEESKEYHTVDVYYGTNRKPTPALGNNKQYGGERHREGPMEYGRTTISIPLHHKIGVVERPKWYKLEFSESPKKHVVIVELDKMEREDFFASVGASAEARPRNEALLFIHGFNVAFDDAIRRTGQIAYDLDFGGVALAFSWPSQSSLKAYTVDEANAEWSIPHLTRFLLDLEENTEIDKIHVIAHSMGTRVLSYALANATDEGFDLDLNNVILAAPDIDVDIFKEQILPKITDSADKMTMYASSDDTALKVSQTIHGNARLGLSGAALNVFEGMDTVNASGIDTSMIGHGYYGSQKVVVRDIFNLVIHGLEPLKRKLIPGPLGEWDFSEPTGE